LYASVEKTDINSTV